MKSTHDVVSRLSVARYINLKIGNGNGQFLETSAKICGESMMKVFISPVSMTKLKGQMKDYRSCF